MKQTRFGWWLALAAVVLLSPAGCKFDTGSLDERRCSTDGECPEGYRCIQNVCQGIPSEIDAEEDLDVIEEEVEPCRDFDEDGVLGGVGCEADPFDCNDFDPAIYPGADEVCDGKDNNCDDLVDTDDAEHYIEVACPLTVGVCTDSVKACVNGRLQDCTAETYGPDYAAVEDDDETLCDGRDNDCDGETDEIERSCYSTEDGLDDPALDHEPCEAGVQQCIGDDTWSDCEGEVLPAADETAATDVTFVCDGVDNDCDGFVDPGCTCLPGEVIDCYEYTGSTLGLSDPTLDHLPCRAGQKTCQADGTYGACENAVYPTTETCANPGVDNDCDGSIDLTEISEVVDTAEVTWGETGCTVSGAQGQCALSTSWACGTDGHLTCVSANVPELETCADVGVDNDCDGDTTDYPGQDKDCEATQRLNAAGDDLVTAYGECHHGTFLCWNDTVTCVGPYPDPASFVETCNDLDDDCDDLVDEDFDTDTDEANCGACTTGTGELDHTCANTCCDGGCVDGSTDVHFCGANASSCGTDCTADTSLERPACCGGTCIDLAVGTNDSPPTHCDACNDSCAGINDTDGTASNDCCDSACVNTQTNELHCGACNQACDAATEQCCGGQCVAQDDLTNCGSCDNDCTVGGTNTTVACCDGTCTDLWDPTWDLDVTAPADRVPCGGCGIDCQGFPDRDTCCPTIANAEIGLCVDATSNDEYCGATCDDCTALGTSYDCCDSGCVDLQVGEVQGDDTTDYCGSCATTCAATEHCAAGECISNSEITSCVATPGDTPADCTLSGTNYGCCDSGSGYGCVDLLTTEDHCGQCDNACPPATNTDATTCCDGFCVDTSSDFNYCLTSDATDECGVACDATQSARFCCTSGDTTTCAAACP